MTWPFIFRKKNILLNARLYFKKEESYMFLAATILLGFGALCTVIGGCVLIAWVIGKITDH